MARRQIVPKSKPKAAVHVPVTVAMTVAEAVRNSYWADSALEQLVVLEAVNLE